MGESLELRKKVAAERRHDSQAKFLEFMLEHEELDYREAAKLISRGDPKKAKMWRTRWRRWMKDPEFQNALADMSMAHLRGGIPAAINALLRRASKGNVPAIKLALEASGFWSPRSTQEHVGEIAITIRGIERAPLTSDDDPAIIEGDVVAE